MNNPLIVAATIATILSSCTPATNLDKKPTRWVTIMDVRTNKPLPHVSLVYYGPTKTYFIVGAIGSSIPYVSDDQGRAHVPEGVSLRPSNESSYMLDSVKTSPGDKNQGEIYYLRRIKRSNPKDSW
jgi:hypothetical protein